MAVVERTETVARAPSDTTSSRATVACAHCGLPVPRGLFDPKAEEQFCCDGCRTVYAIVHASGLADYYSIRENASDENVPARTSGRSYTEFDDPVFVETYASLAGADEAKIELYLEGVHCAACVWLVERLPSVLPGVRSAELDLGRSLLKVRWDPSCVKLSRVGALLDSLGYPAHPAPAARSLEQRRREDRSLLIRIGVAGAAAGNAMVMAFAVYAGGFSDMEEQYRDLFHWGSLAVATPAVLWSAIPFFRSAWWALKVRAPHMDISISLSILAAFAYGAIGTIRSGTAVYFDSITALIFLLLVGRWLQRRNQRAARDTAELLYSLAPSHARLVEGDEVREVPVQSIAIGALLEVRAGDRVPADGRVVEGNSSIDLSLLTGESAPESVSAGERVFAGTTNLSARLVVRAEATGSGSRIGQLLAAVAEASSRRAPIIVLADRIAAWFVPASIGAALLTLLVWLFLEPGRAPEHAIALLVVACPCALGMATPLAISASLWRGAKSGILIKGGEALEGLARASLLVFDKTGTLTEGRLEMVDWVGSHMPRALVRSAESHSNHPVANAFVSALTDENLLPVEHAVQHRAGIEAVVASRSLLVGSLAFVTERVGPLPAELERAVSNHVARAHTPVAIAVDGSIEAAAFFADPLRADARESLKKLCDMGLSVAILSGDDPRVVSAVAAELGVELAWVRGGVTPESKLAIIEQAAQERLVVMIGDGVNDAAALAIAPVGVAVHGGAEASLAAADVFMSRNGVQPVVDLLLGARRTFRTIRRGLVFSIAYNTIGAALAIAGYVSPLLAAVLMPLSSLTVVTNAYRSKSFVPAHGMRDTFT
jgi:Cu2+-exporting ATPase